MKIRTLKDIKISASKTLAAGSEFNAEASEKHSSIVNIDIDGQPFPLFLKRDCEIVREAQPASQREADKRAAHAHVLLEMFKANRIAHPDSETLEVMGLAKTEAEAYLKEIGQ